MQNNSFIYVLCNTILSEEPSLMNELDEMVLRIDSEKLDIPPEDCSLQLNINGHDVGTESMHIVGCIL